jgi:hypothetical protein
MKDRYYEVLHELARTSTDMLTYKQGYLQALEDISEISFGEDA